jgi:hypothetical protein
MSPLRYDMTLPIGEREGGEGVRAAKPHSRQVNHSICLKIILIIAISTLRKTVK